MRASCLRRASFRQYDRALFALSVTQSLAPKSSLASRTALSAVGIDSWIRGTCRNLLARDMRSWTRARRANSLTSGYFCAIAVASRSASWFARMASTYLLPLASAASFISACPNSSKRALRAPLPCRSHGFAPRPAGRRANEIARERRPFQELRERQQRPGRRISSANSNPDERPQSGTTMAAKSGHTRRAGEAQLSRSHGRRFKSSGCSGPTEESWDARRLPVAAGLSVPPIGHPKTVCSAYTPDECSAGIVLTR